MTYYSYTAKECQQLGIQEGELAIYTGTVNPRKPDTLSPNTNSQNAYVYIWQKNGQPRELDTCFRRDSAGLDVLEVRTGKEEYTFLRDKPSGYIRQVSGPARPITVVNLGAIPLRVDTFLGKFTVHAGTMLRLDESAPQREKKKVLFTVSSCFNQPLKSAEVWDGTSWRRLNIREDPPSDGESGGFAVLDGSAIVQYLKVNGKREIFIMDSPELDPDYEIYVTTQDWDEATLCFNRSDYRDGRVVQRVRKIRSSRWGKKAVYDLQKLRESLTQNMVEQCTAELPETPGILEPPDLTVETAFPDGQTGEFAPEKRHPLISDRLREFLASGDNLGEQPSAPEGQGENDRGSDAVSRLWELALAHQDGQKALIPKPEPPENFPK